MDIAASMAPDSFQNILGRADVRFYPEAFEEFGLPFLPQNRRANNQQSPRVIPTAPFCPDETRFYGFTQAYFVGD